MAHFSKIKELRQAVAAGKWTDIHIDMRHAWVCSVRYNFILLVPLLNIIKGSLSRQMITELQIMLNDVTQIEERKCNKLDAKFEEEKLSFKQTSPDLVQTNRKLILFYVSDILWFD